MSTAAGQDEIELTRTLCTMHRDTIREAVEAFAGAYKALTKADDYEDAIRKLYEIQKKADALAKAAKECAAKAKERIPYLMALGPTTVSVPGGALGLSALTDLVEIADESAIPDRFMVTTRTPDRAAIKAHLRTQPGKRTNWASLLTDRGFSVHFTADKG